MKWLRDRYRRAFEQDLVTALHRGLLDREPTAQERQRWLPAGADAPSLSQLVKGFVDAARPTVEAGRPPLFVPPGHFYSPITAPDELSAYPFADTAPPPAELAAIAIDEAGMRAFWQDSADLLLHHKLPALKTPGRRYHLENGAFSWGDGLVYQAILRRFRPRRLIEIGIGHSSACALDTIADHFDAPVEITFIDPNPELMRELVGASGPPHAVVVEPIQAVDPRRFDALVENDILFIDSTHVVKTGSDVCRELFAILPHLNAGVLVHFHDIFYPFDYPKFWAVDHNRSWNEAYALRAFLMYNQEFEIVFFNDFFFKRCRAEIEAICPDFLRNPGGSLWLRKRSPALPRPSEAA